LEGFNQNLREKRREKQIYKNICVRYAVVMCVLKACPGDTDVKEMVRS
jgi:hypothetical protein